MSTLRLLLLFALAVCAAPFAAAQYPTYSLYLGTSALPAGSYGASIYAQVDNPPSTDTFNICFYTGYGSFAPIVPATYTNYYDFSTFYINVPPETIQDIPPGAFSSGSFTAYVYQLPSYYTTCTGYGQSEQSAISFTLNYPTLASVSLGSLPAQNPNLKTRVPSNIAVTGTNFLSQSGTNGKTPSAVNFVSGNTPIGGTVKFFSSTSVISTIPDTIPATQTSVDVEVCNTATYSYCSAATTLKVTPLETDKGSLTAAPNPATPAQPATLTATFGSATASTAGAPGGTVTFADGTSSLGTGILQLNSTASFATAAASANFTTLDQLLPPLVADFNNDGIPDVLLIEQYTNNLNLLPGSTPTGSYGPAKQFSIYADGPNLSILSAAIGDFNHDGYPDVAMLVNVSSNSGSYNTVIALLNDGAGNLTNQVGQFNTVYGSTIVAGDFNKDGCDDVALTGPIDANGTEGIQVLYSDMTGNFTAGPVTDGEFGTNNQSPGYKIVVADFNNDGYPDVAVLNPANASTGALDAGLSVYTNNRKAVFADRLSIPTDGSTTANFYVAPLATGKFPSILVTSINAATAGLSVYVNQDKATTAFSTTPVKTSVPGLVQAAVGDFNGDGFLDVIVDNRSETSVLFGDGTGLLTTFGAKLEIASNSRALIAATDVNADGYADLIALQNNGTVNDQTSYAAQNFITSGTASAFLAPRIFAIGTHALTATTSGTYTVAGGTAQTSLTVAATPTTLFLASFLNSPATYGPPPNSLFATILDPTATGTVSFYNGTTLLGTAPLADSDQAVATFVVPTLPVGSYSFKAVYPGDANHSGSTSQVIPFQITPATPTIAWTPNPATIVYGTALSAAQLDATATGVTNAAVSGSFAYVPALGTVLAAGTHAVVATFTPKDTNYAKTTATRNIIVGQATPTVTWTPNPATIAYGTALSGAQLDATASVPGSFVYTPASGTVLAAGTHTLSATFTPTDKTDYETVTKTVSIIVTSDPTITALAATSGGKSETTVASGAVVTLTATVKTGATLVSPGQVSFCDATAATCTDIHLLATAQLTSAGTATYKFVPGIGAHSYKAVFLGTNEAVGSASSAASLAVTGTYPTTTTIAQTGVPGNYTLTATTTSADGANAAPSGTVSILDLSDGTSMLATGDLVPQNEAVNFAASTVQSILIKKYTSGISSGDLNGDGKPDLVISNFLDNNLSVFLGNGDGTFTAAPIAGADIVKAPLNTVMADFNGDGIPDIAVGNQGIATPSIFLGKGDGTFQVAETPAQIGQATTTPVAGDFNGDGNVDLVFASAPNNLTVMLGNGDGTFTVSSRLVTASYPTGAVAGDFNGDGKLDLAVAIDGAVEMFLGNGDGTLKQVADVVTGVSEPDYNPNEIAAVDLNNDGKQDLVLTGSSSKLVANPLVVLLGNGDGTFNMTTIAQNISTAPPISIADFNGDGVPDILVVPAGQEVLFLGKGNGTFAAPVTMLTSDSQNIITSAIADLNGDGRPDVANANVLGGAQILLTQLTQTAVAKATAISPLGAGTHQVVASYPGNVNYKASISAPTGLTGTTITPVITWSPSVATIPYGTALGTSQLNATAATAAGVPIAGTFIYTPAAGTILSAGSQTLHVTFTPTSDIYSTAMASTSITVTQAIPTVTWTPNPSTITYGTALSAAQLDAASTTPGTFTYTPAIGSVLALGNQTLSVVFKPTDTTDFKSVTATTTIVVATAALTVSATTISFGDQAVDTTSAAQIITLTNPNPISLTLNGITIQFANNPLDFSQTNNCPTSLGPHASCQGSITFTPHGVGPRTSGALVDYIDTSTNTENGVDINLNGTGLGGLLQVDPGNLKTIAGNGTAGYKGDGGSATAAELDQPDGIAFDPQGNLYIADVANSVVRKVDTTGKITTFAGTGTAGYTGDGGAATSAQIDSPYGVVSDAAGNVFIQDTGNSVIRKVDTSGVITTIAGTAGTRGDAGDGGPATSATLNDNQGARFDKAGDLFVPNCGQPSIRKIDTTGIITTVAGNFTSGFSGDGGAATSAELNCPSGVAIDPAGNFYVADYFNNRIRKVDTSGIITTIAGTGAGGATGDGGPATAAELSLPNDVVLDTAGNLYIADSGNNHVRKIDTKGIITTIAGGFEDAGSANVNTPSGVALDPAGNLYFSDTGNSAIREFAPAGSVPFPATPIGTAAAPQTLTLSNIGNVSVTLVAGKSFSIGGNSADFLLTGGTCLNGTTLAPGAGSCTLQITFKPVAAGLRSLTVSIADDALNSPQSFTIAGTGLAVAPNVTWVPTPSDITYGTLLSSAQLDATANVPGTFVYTPAAGTLLSAGSHTLSVTFTPTDLTDFNIVTATANVLVNTVAPVLAWTPNPATIVYGTALSAAQLDATANTPGTFVYTPAAGTILDAGVHLLSVTFTPTDSTDFYSVSKTVQITVDPAPPTVTWTPNPATIMYGTALSSAQLDATSTLAGAYTYGPGFGAILSAGVQTLTVRFHPSDSNYAIVNLSRSVTVTPATPTIAWLPNPAAIAYGTGLSSGQLDATAAGVNGLTLSGTFAYTPALGAVLAAGVHTLSATFTPTDTADYKALTATATITVTGVSPVITWLPNPATIAYGTALSAAQLDATSTVPGTFAYTPALGAVLAAGVHTLSAVFTPTDTADYKALTATATITVNGVSPTIIWTPNPATITYGTALSAAQLDATSTIPGTFAYTPALGAVLAAGVHTLSAVFTPTDTADYKALTATATITVTGVSPVITWLPNPASIAYGTALSAAQLDATSTVPGTFVYTPALGAVLAAGVHTLSAVFTPTDTADYKTLTATATITVTGISPVITWLPNPATIAYGTALSAAQLDATSTVPGTFVYTPALGAVLAAGVHTLSAVFTPTDTADYKALTATATITVTGVSPVITWLPNPATITYGTALSAAQLDATSTVPGTFVYTPALGAVLAAGVHTLSAVFTPTDTADYKALTATATITVTGVSPVITWLPNPATITYGTALSAAQLDATSTVPGTFAYTPALGAVLAAGVHTLSATFTPTDASDYKALTATATITVTGVSPTITWTPNPAIITYGTALSAAQLDATSTVPGTFAYTPALGAVLAAGVHTLSATFTPTDTADYKTLTATATITVTGVSPTIIWTPNPASIAYGTALSAAQLDATSTVPGTFAYTPALGAVLAAGVHTLSAVFTPTDTADYKALTATATITVNGVSPVITWLPNPATIAYGTALSAAQLDATSTVPGTFAYTPALGAVLAAGVHTLSATFTPTDTADYSSVTASASITVSPLALTSLSTISAALGDPAKTITLTGTGFLPTAVVQVNGTAIATTYVNLTTLTAVIPASYFLTVQVLQISVTEAAQNQTSATLGFLVGAPPASVVFSGPSTIAPGTEPDLTFQLTNPYPVDLAATFTITFQPSAGLPDDPTVIFSNGNRTFTSVIQANSTSSPAVQLQSGTVAGTITITLGLQAGGTNVTPASIQPVVISSPLSVPGITSVQMSQSGTTLTVVTRGYSNTREVSGVKFHFTPVSGASITTQDVPVDGDPLFTPYYGSPVSAPYGSDFTYTQTFNLSSDAATVGQVTVVLVNSVGASPAANTP